MTEYKTLRQFEVKGSDSPVEAWIYDRRETFLSDRFSLSIPDFAEVMTLLLEGKDPTQGLDFKGRRFTYKSQEARMTDLLDLIRNYMRKYGDCFREPQPVFFDRERHKLCPIYPDNAWSVLAPIGLAAGLPTFKALSQNLYLEAFSDGELGWPERTVHQTGFMNEDYSALYVWASSTTMIKVTPIGFDLVPLGTDDVLVKSNEMADLPDFDWLMEFVDEYQNKLGNAITTLVPGTPLTELFTTRFAEDDFLSPDQAQRMLLTRLMFVFAAAQHPLLWPFMIITGETGTGKSSPFEILKAWMRGARDKAELDSLPTKMRDFVAYLTHTGIGTLDNVDHAFTGTAAATQMQNLLCQVATGGNISIAELYQTNSKTEHRVQTHMFLTARDMPFEREDVLRRVIHLKTRTGHGDKVKTHILDKALKHRAEVFAEILVRCQNMLRAHQSNANKQYKLQTRMKEYEHFTLLCADFEDALEETITLWDAYMATYNTAITQNNPILTAVLLWLGEEPERANSAIFTDTLYKQVSDLYRKIGLELPYSANSTFGKAITDNAVALKQGAGLVDGLDRETRRRRMSFSATDKQLSTAVAMYKSMTAKPKATARLSLKDKLGATRSKSSVEG